MTGNRLGRARGGFDRRATAILTALIVLGAPGAMARAQEDTGWTIPSFGVEYTIRPDRSIEVVERITVDFANLRRHGIYRDIPVRYQRVASASVPAGRVTVGLDVESVTDETGEERQTQITRGDYVRIRIGDPDRTVTGWQTYVIRYTLSQGLGFFDDHDELYWQVTGTGWPVPIGRAEATVTLPPDASNAYAGGTPWSAACYAGWAESSDSGRCTADALDGGRYHFSVERLEPGEGLTLVAAFPKGVIAPPTAAERAADWAVTYGPLALPVIALGLLFALWSRTGREPVGWLPTGNDAPGDGLRPGPAGTLFDQKADMDDVVATILDLAVRGHIRIREVPPDGVRGLVDASSFAGRALKTLGLYDNDWQLERLDGDPPGLVRHEHEVLSGLFEDASTRRMSDLNNKFYKHLSGIRDALYDEVVRQKLFLKSPETTRKAYRWLGLGIVAAGFIAGGWLDHWILGIGLALSGGIVLLFSFGMPSMTPKGARLRRDVAGLEEYIRRAEKAELEFREAPEKTPEHFSEILPYAVALDVSDIWVQQFESVLASSPPTWYVGNTPGWNGSQFQSGLSGFQSAATKTLGSAPGSSSGMGGGSVGGGGGGGGGGSW